MPSCYLSIFLTRIFFRISIGKHNKIILYLKQFKSEPLVPIGCLTTAYFLGSGIKSFYNRDPIKSQKMMRLRVGSQFATLMIFIGYAGWSAFTLDFAPGMAVPSEQGYGGKNSGGKDKDE